MADYRFVYQPKPELNFTRRRFFVSNNRLKDYIGERNANKAVETAINLKQDNYRMRLRKFGIVDIYLK